MKTPLKMSQIWSFLSFLMIVVFVLAALVYGAIKPAAAKQIPPYCMPPVKPPLVNEAMIERFKSEIEEDFATYFDEIGDYLNCLDMSRATAFAQAQEITSTYNSLFLKGQNRP